MKPSRIVLTIAGCLAAASLAQAQVGGQQIVQPTDKSMADGCWVEIFEDDKYDADDPHVVLKGPLESATLKDIAGRNWNNDIESIVMGPKATMYAYKEKDFKGTEIVFAPNQRVADLSDVKMSNDIESIRIKCAN
jgi:hypothetical protein